MSIAGDPMGAALNHLRFVIPGLVLERVFTVRGMDRWGSRHYSLNERIMMDVIRPRVLVDCSIAYGQVVVIDLGVCEREEVSPYSVVYRVPKEVTQGRSIMSVLNVGYGMPNMGSAGLGVAGGLYSGSLTRASNAVANSHENMPLTSTANAQIIGENTVLIRDSVLFGGQVWMRCVVEHDERMSHLHYKAIPILKKLVEYAVKSYIYNAYLLEMDMAELVGGMELGAFKSVIEEYRDAEQMYQDVLREEYGRAAVSADREQYHRYLKTIVGGYR